MGLVPDPLAHEAHEVRGAAGQLEPDQVGAEQPLEQLPSPRQLLEQLGRWERDVQVEADPQVGAQLAQHLGDQLHLVVVHPDQSALVGQLRGRVREPLVHLDVGVPPLAVELRLGHQVVVERPQRGVGETLVVALDLLGGHRQRVEIEAVDLEGFEVLLGAARPAHPDSGVGAHHGLDRRHQSARGGPPRDRPVRLLDPVDRQPVRDDHEVVAHASTLGTCRAAHSTLSGGGYAARVSGWPDSDCRAGRIVVAPVRDDAGAMTYLMTQPMTETSLPAPAWSEPVRPRGVRRVLLDSGYALSAFFLALPAFIVVVIDLSLGLGLLVLVGGLLLLWVARDGGARVREVRADAAARDARQARPDPRLPVSAARGRLLAQGAVAAARRPVLARRALVHRRA